MGAIMTLSTMVTGINILLILLLLYVYGRNFLKTRSDFAAGLLIFAGIFLLMNLVSFYYFISMMPYFVLEVQPYMLMLHMLQMAGFIVLNWITWR
jgi:hypothetical protein